MTKKDAKTEAQSRLCRTALKLFDEGYISKDGCVSMRVGNTVFINTEASDMSSLVADDLAEINLETAKLVNGKTAHKTMPRHLILYKKRKEINAIIHCTSASVLCSSKAGEVIRPLLDDMAQIVGISLRTAPDGLNKTSLKKMLWAMKGRNSVLVNQEGALCASGSLDDAHAVCQVSEKACKSWIETAFLGGGHKINALESALMRFVYLKKYSKQDVTNRL